MKVILYYDWLNKRVYLSSFTVKKYKMAYKMAATVEPKYTYSIKISRKASNMVNVKQ